MPEKAIKLRITGRVQGVGFRAWAADRAGVLGLNGFVRNRADGSVEAMLMGPAEQVDAMARDCHRGPPGARVESVETEPATGVTPRGFRMLPTV